MKYSKWLSYPLPFYGTQIINHFLNSSFSANRDKVERLSADGEIFIKGLFLYCRILILTHNTSSIYRANKYIIGNTYM